MKSNTHFKINRLIAAAIIVLSLSCFAGAPGNTYAGVDAVTQATATFWPQSYAKIWGEKKDANLSLLRTFRNEVLNNTEAGREITHLLYDNSLELSLLLVLNPKLAQQAKKVADEILPGIKALLCNGEATIRQQAVEDMVALLDQFAAKASPKLKGDLGQIKEILCAGALMDELNVTVIK
ncbi:MAG: hypothetical protein NTV89_00565 [Proteobacteria bacterium]|nr:hypothetical protein [Pseudomonadota bacterium]